MILSSQKTPLLRRAFKWNSSFSLVSGVLCMVLATPLAHWMAPELTTLLGMSFSTFLFVLGVGLVCFSGWVYWVASRAHPPRLSSWIIAIADIDWVIGSVIVLMFAGDTLSFAGKLIIGDVALVVAIFAGLQLMALTRGSTWRPMAFHLSKSSDGS